LAWAQQSDAVSKTAINGAIQVLQTWNRGGEERKVPSQISYSETRNQKDQWGFSIDGNSEVFRWTKLELMPQSATRELEVLGNLLKGASLLQALHKSETLDGEVPIHLVKSSGEVIEDFLENVALHWHKSVTLNSDVVFDDVPLDIVISHPVV
jgi:hypothetical protein